MLYKVNLQGQVHFRRMCEAGGLENPLALFGVLVKANYGIFSHGFASKNALAKPDGVILRVLPL